MTKTCSKCGLVLPIDAFGRDRSRKYGRASACKACYIRHRKAYYIANRARVIAKAKWRLLRDKYGLSESAYIALLEVQQNRCKICGISLIPIAPYGKRSGSTACVDHDHATGRVRGLLCGPCNMGLGHFGDDIVRLGRAIIYLQGVK
jgi:hypothetical protein